MEPANHDDRCRVRLRLDRSLLIKSQNSMHSPDRIGVIRLLRQRPSLGHGTIVLPLSHRAIHGQQAYRFPLRLASGPRILGNQLSGYIWREKPWNKSRLGSHRASWWTISSTQVDPVVLARQPRPDWFHLLLFGGVMAVPQFHMSPGMRLCLLLRSSCCHGNSRMLSLHNLIACASHYLAFAAHPIKVPPSMKAIHCGPLPDDLASIFRCSPIPNKLCPCMVWKRRVNKFANLLGIPSTLMHLSHLWRL